MWCTKYFPICCRLNRGQGSLPSILLSILFFVPTSINAAWLSVASGLGVLIVPLSYGHTAHLEAGAAVTAAIATAAGMYMSDWCVYPNVPTLWLLSPQLSTKLWCVVM